MNNLNYEDFFFNRTEFPEEGSDEYKQLIDQEVHRCLGGVYVDGVFFSGFLYWHLDHWWIRDDAEDEYQNIERKKLRASLRDNEWEAAEYLEQCRVEKKGYLQVGVRQWGKSEIMASYMSYHAELFQHTQNVVVGGNNDDLQLLRDKIDFGIKNLWEGIKIPKIDKDTQKNMVRLGFKAKSGEDDIWSYLIIRNVAEGNKTEGPAGVTAKAYATDEIGKFSFAASFEAAKPAFKSKYGWRCVPLLFGTGGSFEKGADAERFFYHPEANNFLAIDDPQTGKKTAIFFSGLYRIDCKYKTTLAKYLINSGRIPDGHYPNLEKFEMWVSDKEKALELIKKERTEKAKDPDQSEYLKLVMYYPLTPDECFLSVSANIFPVTAAKKHKFNLEQIGFFGEPVEIEHDGEKLVHIISKKKFISSYPTKANDNKDAPIMIYEFPIQNPPYGLYVAGVDPYRQGKAEYSTSLGTVAIFKRMHDLQSEKFQNMFVASLAARPDDQDEWNEQARNLIKFYNARTLCENDEMSFINYMIYQGDERYLEEQPGWLKTLVPTSKTDRKYGIHRSNDTIREYLHSTFKNFLKEVLYRETDPISGSVIREVLGVTRIPDIVALEEIMKYNPDGNFDRLIAYELAVALAKHMDPTHGKVGSEDKRLEAYHAHRKNGHRIFSQSPVRFKRTKMFR